MVSRKTEEFKHAFEETEEPVVARRSRGGDDGLDHEYAADVDRDAWQSDADVLEDSVALYLAESGRTPLLNAREETVLGSQIEDGEHLAQLVEQYEADHSHKASATDIVFVLMERFSAQDWLFETVCERLGLEPRGTVSDGVRNAAFRAAVDGRIDTELAAAIARASGLNTTEITQALVRLSLDTRLIPWDIVEEAGEAESMEQFTHILG